MSLWVFQILLETDQWINSVFLKFKSSCFFNFIKNSDLLKHAKRCHIFLEYRYTAVIGYFESGVTIALP